MFEEKPHRVREWGFRVFAGSMAGLLVSLGLCAWGGDRFSGYGVAVLGLSLLGVLISAIWVVMAVVVRR
jgi:hypothetical protein